MPTIPPNIAMLLIIILLPIVPSYLLFKLLPGKALVKGPFQGLRIDLGGGFAGYFLVFLTLVGVHGSFESTSYEKWSVSGRIVLPESTATDYVDPRYVTLSVPSLRSDSDGNFSLSFLRTSDGQFDFPHLYFNFPECLPKSFWLGPKEMNIRNESLPVSFDTKRHVIDLGIVKLEKQGATQARGSQGNPYAN